jgi:mono/diheme cytochrome c family protein
MRHTPRVIGGILVLGCTALLAQQSQQAQSSATAVYSAEQAAAGEKIYFEKCAVCHGDDLAGREKATALTGAPFVEAWTGKNLRQLLDRTETMPPVAPDQRSAKCYAT